MGAFLFSSSTNPTEIADAGNKACNLQFDKQDKEAQVCCINYNLFPVTVSWQVLAIPSNGGSRTIIASGTIWCDGGGKSGTGYYFSTEGYQGFSVEATVEQCQ